MMRNDVMRIEIFLEYFVNDRREKVDGRIGDIDAKKNQKRRIDRWRHVSLEF